MSFVRLVLFYVCKISQLWTNMQGILNSAKMHFYSYTGTCFYTFGIYLDIILCLKEIGFILQIEWIEPFKEGMIQSKSDVGFTSNGSC